MLVAGALVGVSCIPNRQTDLASISARLEALPDVLVADGVTQARVDVAVLIAGPELPGSVRVELTSSDPNVQIEQPPPGVPRGTYRGYLTSEASST
ncbi:MAG TPA: hypothetical protein VFH51_20255, partial [Myxococcota bacterium]|nr:hypothetical protein [Myxococcota bacterium]